ncbi:hypothetical protein BDP27DRAFT_1426589 [Rhodocollybia butyracea]|uniref:Uncharacterized protein n=1 Tax=Rhodocollybia butyracea TaxID=206335 RepID=A0A9P5PH37_9AGAR|nr:hypothetical protein BDP27DRAFT_1426589 [Rhodocollybia butyracea]
MLPLHSTGSMYSGPPPWTGLCVKIITGRHKGQLGIVHDVNRSNTSSSGLTVTLALIVYTPKQTNCVITVDYNDVREPEYWRTLIEMCPLKGNQSFFHLNSNYTPKQVEREYVSLQRFDIPSCPTTPQPSLDTVRAESNFWNTMNLSESPEPEPSHWIFSPAFNGHSFFVSIAPAHPKFGGFGKYVTRNDHTLSFQKQGGHSEHISATLIQKPNPPPLRTTKHLLAVIEGDHVGQFVRCIYWKEINSEEMLYIASVANLEMENETFNHDIFAVSRIKVVEVLESSSARNKGWQLCKALRHKIGLA